MEMMDSSAADFSQHQQQLTLVVHQQQRPLSSSFRRQSMPQEVFHEGWVEASTTRKVPCIKTQFWRLNRLALAIFPSADSKEAPESTLSLEQIVKIEDATPESPFVFIIRAVGAVIYVGHKQRQQTFMVQTGGGSAAGGSSQQLRSPIEYYGEWMAKLRMVWREPDITNIQSLYEFSTNDILGQGQYGIVYSAMQKSTGEMVAFKSIDNANANLNSLSPETRIPKALNHPGVIRILDVHYTTEKVYIATELLHGDLLNMILSQPLRRLDERVAKFIAYQIVCAVSFLNHYDVVHCDIKPENVLLVSNEPFPQIKLCDFGYSRILNAGSVRRGSFVGTMNYLPPEAICPNPIFNNSLDTWACGVVIYVSLVGVFPYNPTENIRAQVSDEEAFFSPLPWREISPLAKDIVRRMMEVSARKRADCQRLKRHSWFLLDYQLYCDLKALEHRLASKAGDSRRWWSDDLNIGDAMERARVEKNYAPWTEIGCVLRPAPAPSTVS